MVMACTDGIWKEDSGILGDQVCGFIDSWNRFIYSFIFIFIFIFRISILHSFQ